jgi:hypothetical protein
MLAGLVVPNTFSVRRVVGVETIARNGLDSGQEDFR